MPVRVAILGSEEVEGLFINKTAVIPIARSNTAAAAILHQFIGIIRTFLSLLYSDLLSGKEILLSDCSLIFLKISNRHLDRLGVSSPLHS